MFIKEINENNMLDRLLTIYQNEIEEIAAGWQDMGANFFAVFSLGQPLMVWPESALVSYPALQAPIVCRGLPLGELVLAGDLPPGAQTLLDANANFLARLILNEGELEAVTNELVQSQDQLLALYELFHATRLLTQVDEILEAVAHSISLLFRVETAFVWLELPDKPLQLAQYPTQFEVQTLQPLVERVLKKNQQLLVHSRRSQVILPAEIENILILPIQIHQQTTAALGLVNKEDGPFDSPIIKLLKTVVEHAETQIEKAILHEKSISQTKAQTRLQTEMDLARSVQMNLLPQQLPEVEGLDLAGAARPALSVGGDYYDFLQQSNGDLYFTLGDVSGKGLPAALLMAMTRTTMRNIARFWPKNSPETILTYSNAALYDDFTDVGMFVTVFTGKWSPEKKELAFANAGHSPVIYRPNGGAATILEATGVPLGVLPDNLATNRRISFGSGDLLVVATDGFNEARNKKDEMFDYDRLLNLINELAFHSAAEIAASLYTAVSHFSQGCPQEDDQTIIVLKGT